MADAYTLVVSDVKSLAVLCGMQAHLESQLSLSCIFLEYAVTVWQGLALQKADRSVLFLFLAITIQNSLCSQV